MRRLHTLMTYLSHLILCLFMLAQINGSLGNSSSDDDDKAPDRAAAVALNSSLSHRFSSSSDDDDFAEVDLTQCSIPEKASCRLLKSFTTHRHSIVWGLTAGCCLGAGLYGIYQVSQLQEKLSFLNEINNGLITNQEKMAGLYLDDCEESVVIWHKSSFINATELSDFQDLFNHTRDSLSQQTAQCQKMIHDLRFSVESLKETYLPQCVDFFLNQTQKLRTFLEGSLAKIVQKHTDHT